MNHKKMKFITALLAVSALILITINSYAFIGEGDEAKKRVMPVQCMNGGEIASYGNCCIKGTGNCIANPCPPPTEPAGNFCGPSL